MKSKASATDGSITVTIDTDTNEGVGDLELPPPMKELQLNDSARSLLVSTCSSTTTPNTSFTGAINVTSGNLSPTSGATININITGSPESQSDAVADEATTTTREIDNNSEKQWKKTSVSSPPTSPLSKLTLTSDMNSSSSSSLPSGAMSRFDLSAGTILPHLSSTGNELLNIDVSNSNLLTGADIDSLTLDTRSPVLCPSSPGSPFSRVTYTGHELTSTYTSESTSNTTTKCNDELVNTDVSLSSSDISQEKITKALQTRGHVLQELAETERDYVRDLGLVVEGYMAAMRKDPPSPEFPIIPHDLKNGKDKIVFGNIEAIYEWHRDTLLAEIENCLHEPQRLALLFKKYERRFGLYVVYCQNKPKSEYIVNEYESFFEEVRQKFGHKLLLADLLIKPVQRITKYQLILNELYKCTIKAGLIKEAEDLQKAIHVMHIVPKKANDMMSVGRLQGFEGNINAQGNLLLQDILHVSDIRESAINSTSIASLKLRERQVFLFEQIVILSEPIGGSSSSSSKASSLSYTVYSYKNHLQVNKMTLMDKSPDDDARKFILKSKGGGVFGSCSSSSASGNISSTSTSGGPSISPDPSESIAFVFRASSPEHRQQWYKAIKGILETQLDFLRALQSPIAYQKELTKDL